MGSSIGPNAEQLIAVMSKDFHDALNRAADGHEMDLEFMQNLQIVHDIFHNVCDMSIAEANLADMMGDVLSGAKTIDMNKFQSMMNSLGNMDQALYDGQHKDELNQVLKAAEQANDKSRNIPDDEIGDQIGL